MMWVIAGLWWSHLKTGEESGTSITPTIPLIPIVFVCIAFIVNALGFEHGIVISLLLSSLLFSVSFVVFVYAFVKNKNT